ncbi:MAG: GNAT family N-acetyltransferase [Spirochaetota bacterium]
MRGNRNRDAYEIVDLGEESLPAFCGCLAPDEETMREAGRIKADWCRRKMGHGFGAKLARLSDGSLAGMIQYLPIAESPAAGENLFFVSCVWIPPAKRNAAGRQRGRGIGSALLRAAEEDARARGAGGLVVWGTTLPFFMRSAWFRKRGYEAVDKDGISELLWKPFDPSATPPRWRSPSPLSASDLVPGKVTVTRFVNGVCPAMNAVHERFARAAAELGDRVVVKTVDTSTPEAVERWGQTDAISIDGRPVPMGPPPSYAKILKTLRKAVRRL